MTNTITVADLDEVGGVAGAIGRRAEQIYQSFDDRCRAAVHLLFLRLVSVTEEHGDTRRRVRRTELEQAGIATEDLGTVLAEYGRHRLLTFDRDPASRTPTVELAHEALLTDWERFAGWVDDAREDLLARRRLESATRDWINAGTDASFLYGGGRLELAEAWAAGSRFEPSEDERRFLVASREKANPERAILLALAAMQKTAQPSPEVISALHRATQSARLTRRIEGVVTGSMDLSPDSSTVAVDHADRTGYKLIDTASGKTVADVTTPLGVVDWFAFAFNPSRSTLAVAVANPDGSNSAIELYDVASSGLVKR